MSTRYFCDCCGEEIRPLFARYSASLTAKNEYCVQKPVNFEDLCGLCACNLLTAMAERDSS